MVWGPSGRYEWPYKNSIALKFTRILSDNHRDKFTILTNISATGSEDYEPVNITICDIIPSTLHAPYAVLLDTFKLSRSSVNAPRSPHSYYQPNLYTSYKRNSKMDAKAAFTHCSDVNLRYGESLLFQYDCRKVFRHREHFPHDASRGLIVQPAIIEVREGNDISMQTFVVGSNLLVTSSTPDFSMPFNVITLVTTVAAILMGAMINVLIRNRHMKDGKTFDKKL